MGEWGTPTVVSQQQQRQIEQDEEILRAARTLLLDHGYFGITMAQIAKAADMPKATLYQRFSCKEDIILALEGQCLFQRLDMLRRGASYPGHPRERLAAMGEATALYARLHPDDSRIIHNAGGPLRDKASAERLREIIRLEHTTTRTVRSIVAQAVELGDLELHSGDTVERITYAMISLVEGAYSMAEVGIPQHALGIPMPIRELWCFYNLLADAYQWRPLFAEQNWEETMAHIRRNVFPEEAQQLYGEECWYGDAGTSPPPHANTPFGADIAVRAAEAQKKIRAQQSKHTMD